MALKYFLKEYNNVYYNFCHRILFLNKGGKCGNCKKSLHFWWLKLNVLLKVVAL